MHTNLWGLWHFKGDLYYKPEIKISKVWETNEIISLVQFTIEFINKLSTY